MAKQTRSNRPEGGAPRGAGGWKVEPALINVVDGAYDGRFAHACAVPGAIMLMAGQGSVSAALRSAERGTPWVPGTEWMPTAPLNRKREYCAGGLVPTPAGAATPFVLGGRAAGDDNDGSPYVEWIEGDQWWAEDVAFPYTRLAAATVPGVGLLSCGGLFRNQSESVECRLWTLVPREQRRESDPRLKPKYYQLEKLPAARFHHTAVWMPPHHVWVVGGEVDRPLGKRVLLTEVWVYDLDKNTWTPGPALPSGLSRHAAALDRYGILWVAGGSRGAKDNYSRQTHFLRPGARAWKPGPPLKLGRNTHGLVSGPDGALYALGGASDVEYVRPDGMKVNVCTTVERLAY